jgi:hypothetical protein
LPPSPPRGYLSRGTARHWWSKGQRQRRPVYSNQAALWLERNDTRTVHLLLAPAETNPDDGTIKTDATVAIVKTRRR